MHPGRKELQVYLTAKGESFSLDAQVSEQIKSSLSSIIYSLKFDPASVDQDELSILEEWATQHWQVANDRQRMTLQFKKKAIEKRI